MATYQNSDDKSSSSSESDASDVSDSDTDSDVETDCVPQKTPCKYYNSSHCQDGDRCRYLHVCQYALKGKCRNGDKCKLKHPTGEMVSSRAKWTSNPSTKDPKLTNGRQYQWQLNDGKGWKDVDNDHILEAQYCLPHTKSIKLYNTPYGAVSIDFNRMRVYGKSIGVRRLDDGKTDWYWYCALRRKWRKYGDKDSKGNTISVKSSDIERQFQSNPSGSFVFKNGTIAFEIKFTEMRQVSRTRKRRVTRRPACCQKAGTGVSQATSGMHCMSLGAKWEFEGSGGRWHEYKQKSGDGSSVCSDDIERHYRQNQSGSMKFQVKGQSYKLDFRAMTQTNLSTNKTRKVRRV